MIKDKIDNLLESFENTCPPTLEQTRNRIISLIRKELKKSLPTHKGKILSRAEVKSVIDKVLK